MAIFQISGTNLDRLESCTFAELGIKERSDLQNMLRADIDILLPDSLVIAEEFGNWEDSKRRIDLLAIDKDANFVVIEIKRTEDGGHMELQAIRYAAMVSTMTFDQAVSAFDKYLADNNRPTEARQQLLDFLEWEAPDDDQFGQDVRIVLASGEFSKELTTSVLWLIDYGLDIQCVRMRPFKDQERILLDIERVIPLPETEEYQIKIRDKVRQERSSRTARTSRVKYDITIDGTTYQGLVKRRTMQQLVTTLYEKGISIAEIAEQVPWKGNMFRSVEGTHDGEAFRKLFDEKYPTDSKVPKSKRYLTLDNEIYHSDGKTYALYKSWGNRFHEALDRIIDHFDNINIQYEINTGT